MKKNKERPSSKFSRFFLEFSSREQKKIIKEAAKRANQDQRDLFYRAKAITNSN